MGLGRSSRGARAVTDTKALAEPLYRRAQLIRAAPKLGTIHLYFLLRGDSPESEPRSAEAADDERYRA